MRERLLADSCIDRREVLRNVVNGTILAGFGHASSRMPAVYASDALQIVCNRPARKATRDVKYV